MPPDRAEAYKSKTGYTKADCSCPAITSRLGRGHYSHIVYSDDHGESWKLGSRGPGHQVNECEVVELAGGRLMLNMRKIQSRRRTARSPSATTVA